ncbi:IS4 family transposase (plasmid) [Phormidium sp. CLA17]|uniref:IS4 family transposase n=1 Tax=Leptolyngbya sp. Cla-17 TaxID=2803751 RepID=UPI001490EE71|nr:IS4 family transposase [Leptolyngbya sp. Cla-17]MBM0740138.1 IS4 family transposase [Leptolyngbya sp. Cla-17]MBM0744599.1 IS4 family transposase [Leptolyngbya sp. Cla-17]MBM0745532.1 IS4 family transposase [Leptolyngbya sp. Cla-17]MBM0745609.1 IS4 family transposase [Leptolyngbya sp. Cla-17]
MSQYSELKRVLQEQLNWHGARISFLALFLLALLKVKTVNLSELCVGFGGRALPESSYKRLQRFFRGFALDEAQLASVVVSWMQIPEDWVLSLDRTTWKFGTQWYNILTLGIVHEGVAFPVLWWLLDKRGNSNSDERMRLMETFAKRFPTARVNYLCADREFIGQAWVRYLLLEPTLAFRLRIRSSDQIEHDGRVLAARVVFAHLQPGQSQQLTGTCRVWGYPVAVEALRLDDGELLVVIAPLKAQDLVKDYALRWGIETLFGIFKTRGFCLESTHFTDDKRLSKLFALLTLALCWAMRTGLWLHQWQPIKIKKHGRRAKSLFRLGFDYLRHLVLNPSLSNESDFVQSLQLLSCT